MTALRSHVGYVGKVTRRLPTSIAGEWSVCLVVASPSPVYHWYRTAHNVHAGVVRWLNVYWSLAIARVHNVKAVCHIVAWPVRSINVSISLGAYVTLIPRALRRR